MFEADSCLFASLEEVSRTVLVNSAAFRQEGLLGKFAEVSNIFDYSVFKVRRIFERNGELFYPQ